MISIPMNGHVQSPNASVAAAILMYEVFEIGWTNASTWKLCLRKNIKRESLNRFIYDIYHNKGEDNYCFWFEITEEADQYPLEDFIGPNVPLNRNGFIRSRKSGKWLFEIPN